MGNHREERRLGMYVFQAIGVDNLLEAGRAPKVRDKIRMFPAAGQEQAYEFNRLNSANQIRLGM